MESLSNERMYKSVAPYEIGKKNITYYMIIAKIKSRIMDINDYAPEEAQRLREYINKTMSENRQDSIMQVLVELEADLERIEKNIFPYRVQQEIHDWIVRLKDNSDDLDIEELRAYLEKIRIQIGSLGKNTSIVFTDIENIYSEYAELLAIILAIYTRRNNGIDTLINSDLILKSDKNVLEVFLKELLSTCSEHDKSKIRLIMNESTEWIYSVKIWNWVGDIYKIPIEVDLKNLNNKEDNSEEYSLILPEKKDSLFKRIINSLLGRKEHKKEKEKKKTIETKPRTLKSLNDLDYMEMSRLISDKDKIEFEKNRLKREYKNILDEEIYIPDGLEVLFHYIEQCEINAKNNRISFKDKYGVDIEIYTKYLKEELSIGSKIIVLDYDSGYLNYSVLYYIKMVDYIYGTDFINDCIGELVEHRRIADDHIIIQVPEDFSVIYRVAKNKYKSVRKECNNLIFKNEGRLEIIRKQYYDNLEAKKEREKEAEDFKSSLSIKASNQILSNENAKISINTDQDNGDRDD